MANTEQIEAKLCAYVDGELDAAGRAEIEQHLAANPQHRQLLNELMEQRQLLGTLPREKAPEDLSEALQAHLERSVLLGGQQSPQIAGKISHWPQFMALAAVVVLAIGLASVIYFVLPDQNKQMHNYAALPTSGPTGAPAASVARGGPESDFSLTPPTTPPTTIASDTAPKLDVDALARGGGSGVSAKSEASSEAKSAATSTQDVAKETAIALAPAPAVAAPSDAASAPAPTVAPTIAAPTAVQTAPGAATTFALNDKKAAKGESDIFGDKGGIDLSKSDRANDVEIRGRTGKASNVFDQPPLAPEIQARVTQSPQIAANSVVFVVASDNPTATDRQVTGYLGQNNIHWDDVSEPMPHSAQTRPQTEYLSKLAPRSMRLRDSTSPAAKGGEEFADAARKLEDADKQKSAAQSQAIAPTTQPSPAPEFGRQTTEVGKDQAQAQQVQQLAQAAQSASSPTRYIVARNLTQQQILDLNGCLVEQNGGRIANYRRSGQEIMPTTLSTAGTSQIADNIYAMQTRAPTSQPVQQALKIARQENVPIKQLDTREKAATQPQDSFATTQNSFGAVGAAAIPTTRSSAPALAAAPAQPVAAAPPTTQPATAAELGQVVTAVGAATHPTGAQFSVSPSTRPTTSGSADEERVDVVIVVKSQPSDQLNAAAAAPPATAPTVTQPTTAK